MSETAAKQRRVSPTAALAGFARRQTTVLATTLGSLLDGEDAEAIHDLRVATRRAQALLGVLSVFPGADALRPLRRSLRKLRSVLGEWRNCDVSLQEIDRRRAKAEGASEAAAWQRIESDLRRRRTDAVAAGRARIRRAIDKDLSGRITSAVDERLRAIRAAALRQALDGRIERAWDGWSECLKAAEQAPTVESVHALRIATKRVRYAVELERDVARARTAPVLAWARRAQKALGDWHDQETLHRAIAEAVARPDLALADPEATLAVLGVLARERRGVPALDRNLLALAYPDDALAAIVKWRKPPRKSALPLGRDERIFTDP